MEPLYDYVKVIKIEMCYFDKWVGEDHVGVVKRAQRRLMNCKSALHPEGVLIHSTQHLDVLIRSGSADFVDGVLKIYEID